MNASVIVSLKAGPGIHVALIPVRGVHIAAVEPVDLVAAERARARIHQRRRTRASRVALRAHHAPHSEILHLAGRNGLRAVARARPRVAHLRLDAAAELGVQDADEDVDGPCDERRGRVHDARPGLGDGVVEAGGEQEAEAALDGAGDEQGAAQPEVDVGGDDHARVGVVEFVVEDLGGGLDGEEAEEDESDNGVVVV